MATTNKNFKVKNGLEVAGEIGVGATPSYGTAGQLLSSQGTGSAAIWVDQTSLSSSTVKHQVKLGESIAKGQAVYVSTATGANMIVSKASNTTEATSSKTMGLLETGGVLNDQVNVITEGMLDNIDVGSASAGDPVWLGTSGNLIYGLTNKPIAPAHLVFIGIVTKEGTAGTIFVRVQNGFELNEIHNVLIGTDYTANSIPADNEVLAFDSTSSLWINQTASEAGLAALSGATFTGNVAGTNLSLSGDANVAGKLSVTASSGDEGGEIFLNKAVTNTTITGGVTIDIYQNKIRFFEQGGTARGAFIDIANASAGVGSNILAGAGGGTVTGITFSSPLTGGTISTSGTVGINSSSTNTVNYVVQRDANGSFAANIITANIALANVTGLGTNVATFLGTPNSLNLLNTITDETGSGLLVFATSPVLTTPNIGAAIGTSLNVTANVTVNGNTQLGLAETQKVVDVRTPVDTYTLANNTYTINLSSGNYFSNITTQRLYNSSSGWTIVGTNTYSTNATATSPLTYNLISSGSTAQGDVAIVVVTTDSGTNALPTVNLTASPGWTTNSAAAITYGSAVFYKTLGATPDTTIVLNYGATDVTAVASIVIRSSDILPVYVSAIATPNIGAGTTGIQTPPATTTTIANTLVVTALAFRNDIVSVATSTGPTGYSNYTIASSGNVAGTAAASMLATKFVATVGTETPTAFAPKFANGVAVSDYSSAWTFQVAAYLDPTITLTNAANATYPASTYVLHINNSPNTTTTWSGVTFRWQNNTAPTLSSGAGLTNNIVILETIDGSTFRGAVLNSYA